jgi:predicted Rdx family selenoprotein
LLHVSRDQSSGREPEGIDRAATKNSHEYQNGGPGSLDVWLDGARIFSQKQEGRFPQSGEIIRLIQAKA